MEENLKNLFQIAEKTTILAQKIIDSINIDKQYPEKLDSLTEIKILADDLSINVKFAALQMRITLTKENSELQKSEDKSPSSSDCLQFKYKYLLMNEICGVVDGSTHR